MIDPEDWQAFWETHPLILLIRNGLRAEAERRELDLKDQLFHQTLASTEEWASRQPKLAAEAGRIDTLKWLADDLKLEHLQDEEPKKE